MAKALEEVKLEAQQSDGLIRFGDVLQIHSAVSQSALACDLHDKVLEPLPRQEASCHRWAMQPDFASAFACQSRSLQAVLVKLF